MKIFFAMFAFFVVMLLIVAITDKTKVLISERNLVGYADAEMLLANEDPMTNTKSE